MITRKAYAWKDSSAPDNGGTVLYFLSRIPRDQLPPWGWRAMNIYDSAQELITEAARRKLEVEWENGFPD